MTELIGSMERRFHFAAVLAICAVLPFAIAATCLYPQPYQSLILVGKLAHIISLFCAFFACAVLARHLISKALIILVLPIVYVFSYAAEEVRIIYLIALMYLFFLVGLALIQVNAAFVRWFTILTASVSLPVMLLQLYGWPEWINTLATHGASTAGHVGIGLKPTLFVDAANLDAIYWQTRAAGIFASNQMNTLFFGVFFAVVISLKGRTATLLLPVAAVYAVATIAKASIFGSAIFSVLLAIYYRGDYIQKMVLYILWLILAFLVFYFLFPGVVETYLSPYVITMSILARIFDLLDSLGLEAAIESIQNSQRGGALSRVIIETTNAFSVNTHAASTKVVDYSSIGNLTLYSEMARAPALSATVIAGAILVAIVLNYKNGKWSRLQPMQFALAAGLLLFSIVAPVATQQSYWLLMGMALPCIYGRLLRVEPLEKDCEISSEKHSAAQVAG